MVNYSENIGLVKDVVYGICRSETSIRSFCAGIHISMEELNDPDKHVGLDVIEHMFTKVQELTGQEHVGLMCGKNASLSTWGMVGHLVQVSPNIRMALYNVCRFYTCFSNAIEFEMHDERKHTVLELIPAPGWQEAYPRSCRHCITYTLAAVLRFMSELAKRQVVPAKIEVGFEQPKQHMFYEAAFKAPVHFSASRSSKLYLPSQVMQIPIAGYNVQRYEHFRQTLEDVIQGTNMAVSCTDSVKREIFRRVNGRRPYSIELVAEGLSTSVRTLQRRLDAEGTSFQQEVDKIRKEIAQQLLKISRFNITEVAVMLGYNDSSAFRKAFKKWTGVNPKKFALQQHN